MPLLQIAPSMKPTSVLLEELAFARSIADHAHNLGVTRAATSYRVTSSHLGAVLADAALQAGVSYRTVVKTRVERIQVHFPEAATLPGLLALLQERGVSDFLLWNHHIKTSRFLALTQLITLFDIATTLDLRLWLHKEISREHLLSLHGIGPKTYDYLCCLVGIDCIAVDRHVRTFANEAGVPITDYSRLKSVVSSAADLLGMARRDFDSWIWQTMSTRNLEERQLRLIPDCFEGYSH